MLSERRVKIMATLGPSLSDEDNLQKALQKGLNIARLNFSHGTHEDHLKTLGIIRGLSEKLMAPVGILQDLQGPKIRVGQFPGGSIHLQEGEEVEISHDFDKGGPGKIPTEFKEIMLVASRKGQKILLDDGLLELEVISFSDNQVKCRVVLGGELKDRKGMNFPHGILPVGCLTQKDKKDLEFGLKHEVEFIALSFVRSAQDILDLKKILKERKSRAKVIAKIERYEALENIDEIIEHSDGIMVARGDLAVEIDPVKLPIWQKKIIEKCNDEGVPVIIATQMLSSMVFHPRPTKAELTDVANAVLDGADCLMLSNETASGAYPIDCIRTMHDIISAVESEEDYDYGLSLEKENLSTTETISQASCLSALKLNAAAIVCLTTSGKTATEISSYRPRVPIVAFTDILSTLNSLQLVWGIQTFSIHPYKTLEEAWEQVESKLLAYKLVKPQDKVVLTLGLPVEKKAKTNSIQIFEIGKGPLKPESIPIPLRCREDI